MLNCRFREQEREESALLGPPHPGEILREEIWPQLKLSKRAAAKKMKVSRSAVSNLLKERRRVSKHLALGLAEISGIGVIYWLVLQAHHDAWQLEQAGLRRPSSNPRRGRKAGIAPKAVLNFDVAPIPGVNVFSGNDPVPTHLRPSCAGIRGARTTTA